MAKTATKNAPLTLDTLIVTAKSPARKGNPERVMDGIANLTAIGRVIADLEAAELVVDGEVRTAANKIFLDDGCARKAQPGNFKGCEVEIVDGSTLTHSVSIELKRYAFPLSEEAQALAEEHKVPVHAVPTTNPVTYMINAKYATDMIMMEKVLKALNPSIVKGDLPTDILVPQTKVVTNDDTLPAIFKLEREVAEILLPVFSTMSVGKGKFGVLPGQEDDLTPALDRTAKLINRPGFRSEMQRATEKAKADKAKRYAKKAAA